MDLSMIFPFKPALIDDFPIENPNHIKPALNYSNHV
jgi:hypothetical protein